MWQPVIWGHRKERISNILMCKNAGKIFILISKVAIILRNFPHNEAEKEKKHEIEHIFDL